MKNIFLIGFMGSGKSSVGKQLSEGLNCDYIDTDTIIETTHNKTIPEIFAREGEASFRKYESNALHNIPTENCVVSTGGGIVERSSNIDQMVETGIIVYLETDFRTIDKRLQFDTSRPLWRKNKDEKKQLYDRRIHLYQSCAAITVSTDNKLIDDLVFQITSQVANE
ncbi:shikimate kinase [Virgibacillus phasianinus]|uniref:Shikimate kinase n=1 Tax=Virgibacillus phasianinus TaxID=2017483 RepID=A0A220U529_9BACI|nr:shikimate kinase [Virgibacillus phasianinus]ASK63209.1 shikimate kinase [Virgibacillus phasianinus]